MTSKMRRRIVKSEDVKGDRWIVSYADLLTLLFCFFVVMYSISSLDSGKYALLSNTLEQQLSDERDKNTELTSESPEELTEDQLYTQNVLEQAEKEINQIAADVEQEFHQLIDEDRVKVKRNKFWLEVEFNSNLLYPSGSSQLLDDAKPILISLARRLAPMKNRLNIEGFTDNRPISLEFFPSNWELSAARAATVVRLFEINGIEPGRMASIGYGEHHPIADNNTDEGRALNRRVVVVVMAAMGERNGAKKGGGGNNPRIYQLDSLQNGPFALQPMTESVPSVLREPMSSRISFEFQFLDAEVPQAVYLARPDHGLKGYAYEYSF